MLILHSQIVLQHVYTIYSCIQQNSTILGISHISQRYSFHPIMIEIIEFFFVWGDAKSIWICKLRQFTNKRSIFRLFISFKRIYSALKAGMMFGQAPKSSLLLFFQVKNYKHFIEKNIYKYAQQKYNFINERYHHVQFLEILAKNHVWSKRFFYRTFLISSPVSFWGLPSFRVKNGFVIGRLCIAP